MASVFYNVRKQASIFNQDYSSDELQTSPSDEDDDSANDDDGKCGSNPGPLFDNGFDLTSGCHWPRNSPDNINCESKSIEFVDQSCFSISSFETYCIITVIYEHILLSHLIIM